MTTTENTTDRSIVVYTVTTTLPDGHSISRDFADSDEAAEAAARILEARGSSLEAFGGTVASLTSDLNAITEGIEEDGDGYAGVVEFQYRAGGATVKVAV